MTWPQGSAPEGSWIDRLDDPRLLPLLAEGHLVVEGRIAGASNTTVRCRVESAGDPDLPCVYKPTAGERPLWDFPEWTLTRRELAAYELSEALGWHLVPPTAWRSAGPAGAGMCQLWIDADPRSTAIDVVPAGALPEGWISILDATDGEGRAVELVHACTDDLMRIALFDVIANNADRKGGHVLVAPNGRVWAIDHGVTFAVEDKLRTVLWGWVADPVPGHLVDELAALDRLLGESFDPLDRWLGDVEREMVRRRLRSLLDTGRFPVPSGGWPAVPWPVF